jgi:hypothetical protein
MANKIIHKHSNVVTDGQAKLPTSSQLEYGELAINYADGVETISIRNSADEIIEFRSKEYVDELKNAFQEHEEVAAEAINDLDERVKSKSDVGHTHVSSNITGTISAASGITSNTTLLTQGKAVYNYAAPKNHTHQDITNKIDELKSAIEDNEFVVSTAINELNERTEGVENSLNNVNKSLGGRIDSIEDIIENMGTAGGGSSFGGLLNIKDNNAVKSAQDSLTENKSLKTFIITDSEGNYPSPNINTIYLDDLAALRDLLYRGNDNALKYLLDTKEAYYNYLGAWYSQNISQQVKLPKFNLTTAKVGDLVTIIRYEFTADEFYSKYIDFSAISNDNTAFQAYKLSQGFYGKSDGEFIQHLISNGTIHSCPVNPQVDNSVSPVPLSVNGKVIFYTAQITPNTQTIFSGEFWTGNMISPGIYSYVTSGRPDGTNDIFTGYVSPNGAQMLVSTTNPENTYFRNSINDSWRRVGVGKNTGGTGEVFNDYINNTAHEDHGHAEGQNCHANSYNAHAEGYSTNAGWNAHSEGSETNASGRASHAEGSVTEANGDASHAEGEGTTANGYASHAEGRGTIANGESEHAEGMYNISEENQIHSVGIGTSDNAKNAHTIFNDGRHYIYGIGGYDGTNVANSKDLATVVNATKVINVTPLFTPNETITGITINDLSKNILFYDGTAGEQDSSVKFYSRAAIDGGGFLVMEHMDDEFNIDRTISKVIDGDGGVTCVSVTSNTELSNQTINNELENIING